MTEDRYTRITLRIPVELDEMLNQEAQISSKSKNAEIIARLEESFLDMPDDPEDLPSPEEASRIAARARSELKTELRKFIFEQVRKAIARGAKEASIRFIGEFLLPDPHDGDAIMELLAPAVEELTARGYTVDTDSVADGSLYVSY